MGDYGLQIHNTPLKEGEIREDGGGEGVFDYQVIYHKIRSSHQ